MFNLRERNYSAGTPFSHYIRATFIYFGAS